MSTFAEVPGWVQRSEGSDNHFDGVMISVDNARKEVSSRPIVKDDLSSIPDSETGRGGAYMWKKGDSRHSWTRRYFEVKQQIVYYFAEPTDEKPLGVIPLDGCQIKVPSENAQFFEDHTEAAVNECYEFWISHPHRRLFCICAKSLDERKQWVASLVKRTKKGFQMGGSNRSSLMHNPTGGVSSGPPPGLQGADDTPVKGKKKKKKKKKEADGDADGADAEDRENAVKDLLNRSRRASMEEAQLAMQNTSTLRRRLSSTMTPDALKAIADPKSPAAVRERKKPVKKEDVALENWQKGRMELIKKLVDEETEHPMTLSFLLRGQLIALDRVMAEPPHPNAKVDVPHIKGDWAGEVVISVFNRYSNKKGQMEYANWLSFMEDIDLVNTHLGPNEDVKKFDATDVWRKVLRLDMGKEVDIKKASFPEFYTFILVLCDRAYSHIFQRSATDAMELFLHEVIVPIYYFHMGEVDHEKCASRDPLVKDGRITLLLNAYLPNLWRVFLHYAQDLANRVPATFDEEGVVTEFGTHKPLPEELAFPKVAQSSERSLFEGVTNLPSMAPDADRSGKSVNQVYTIHASGILRFCEDYGLNEIVTKSNILKTYKNVVGHRFRLKGFAPPKVSVKPHPQANNKTMVKGGKPRSPSKKGPGEDDWSKGRLELAKVKAPCHQSQSNP